MQISLLDLSPRADQGLYFALAFWLAANFPFHCQQWYSTFLIGQTKLSFPDRGLRNSLLKDIGARILKLLIGNTQLIFHMVSKNRRIPEYQQKPEKPRLSFGFNSKPAKMETFFKTDKTSSFKQNFSHSANYWARNSQELYKITKSNLYEQRKKFNLEIVEPDLNYILWLDKLDILPM